MNKILYIINPAGHGGKATRAWEKFKILWPDKISSENTIITENPGHAREIAAASKDYDIFAAVGGDGTVGEIMSGIMDRQDQQLKIAVIPAGTGNDIGRNLGIYSIEDAVGALRGGQCRVVDLIRVDCRVSGRPAHKYAFLFGSAGFSPTPMIRPWMKNLLGPKGAYYLATFLQVIVYQASHMTIRIDGQEQSGRNWMITVANVEKMAGGSMCLAPKARIDDGKLDISIFPFSKSKFKIITKFLPKVATGRHINEPGVSYLPGMKIEVESTPPVILDLDGDIFGTTPATFTVCPSVMQVMTVPCLQPPAVRP